MARNDPRGDDTIPRVSAKADSVRKDPVARWADGSAPYTKLQNTDPNRKYVFVDKTNRLQLGMYEMLGYERETRRPDGPKPILGDGASIGDSIEVMDMVLMSIPIEKYQEQYQSGGPDGSLGQRHFDMLEERIIDRAGEDSIRGIHRRRDYAIINETSPIYGER